MTRRFTHARSLTARLHEVADRDPGLLLGPGSTFPRPNQDPIRVLAPQSTRSRALLAAVLSSRSAVGDP